MVVALLAEHATKLQVLLGIGGSLAGIAWAVLGLRALSYLKDANEEDRTYGWTLWWFFNRHRYTEPGQDLCNRGLLAAFLSVACWLAVYGLQP